MKAKELSNLGTLFCNA